MKKLILILLAATLLVGCAATKQAVVVREISRDTLYLNHIQYDSIYVDNWQLTDRTKDTIYLEKSHIEYRYKLLRDTVYKVQVDTIPVIKTVEVVKTEHYVPGIYKWSLGICILLVVLIVCFILKKFVV